VAPLGGFLVVATFWSASSEAAGSANFELAGGTLLADELLDAAGLLAIDELAIDELVMAFVLILVTTGVMFDTVATGLAALFELAGELPHATASASSAKSTVISRTLFFIKLFLSNARQGPQNSKLFESHSFNSNRAPMSIERPFCSALQKQKNVNNIPRAGTLF